MKVELLSNEVTELHRQNAHLTSKLDKCKQATVDLECYSRRENLVFEGVNEVHGDKEDTMRTIQTIFTTIQVDQPENIKIQRAHRMGPSKPGTNRPIIVRFQWYQDRQRVWSNKKHLKGSAWFVKEDFPLEIEKEHRKLYPTL